MKIITRAYNPESNDFKNLCRFVVDDNGRKKEYFVWQLGRIVDWKYGLWHQSKFFPNFFRKNAQLWIDYWGEIVGFAISENGDSSFYVFVKDTHMPLYEEIVQWVVEHWGDRDGSLQTELNEAQITQRRILERTGFTTKGVSAITRVYDLKNKDVAQPVLESGFKVVDMARQYDPVGKAKLQLNAFSNRDNVEEIDLLTRDYVRESPIYEAEFDLSIINPQGEHVAGCEAFIDYENGVAEIERVCTHSGYRRRGLAKAVIKSCFLRLRDHGICTAYITGWDEATNNLYGKLGHSKQVKRSCYELIR